MASIYCMRILCDDFCIQSSPENLRDLLVGMIPGELASSQLVKLAAAIFDVEPTDFLLLDDSQEIPQWFTDEG